MNSKDPKYIQNDPIWAQKGPKWAQMSKPKWIEKGLNELKWALMSSNFNKIFTSDAYQGKTWGFLSGAINVENKEKKCFCGSFS